MSHRFKKPKKIGSTPLPHRLSEETLLKRIASVIDNQTELDAVLNAQPRELRKAYVEKLAPYLKFEPAIETIPILD